METTKTEQQDRYVRLKEIVGDRKAGVRGIVPISPAHVWALVKIGKFPKPIKLSEKCTVWKLSEILRFMDSKAWQQQAAS